MTGPTAAVRRICWERAGGYCERCGYMLETHASYSLHHRRARGMGGTRRPETNLPANLVFLCGSATSGCHGQVERFRMQARRDGWLVSSRAWPTDVLVLYRGVLSRLHDDGSVRPVAVAS